MKRKPRPSLYKAGRHGDQVRVVADHKEKRAIVHFRDADGIPRKKKFALTKEGKAEAIAFAEGWHTERERQVRARLESAAPSPITVRELWTAFANSEFSDERGEGLRRATQISYTQHWAKFERFIGRDRAVETIKVPELAVMRKEERAAGRALNQIRQTQNVVRIVVRWGIEHELLSHSPLAIMRWKSRKDQQKPVEPGEYTTEEFLKLLSVVDKTGGRQWRIWVFLMLCGHYGQRANAVLHLRWRDIDVERDIITWPGLYQKQGKDLERPLLWEAWSALLTAKQQRERVPTMRRLKHHTNPLATAERLDEADWVLFAERDKAKPMSYSSMHYHLVQAERRAGVVKPAYTKAHAFRRMVVGNVIEATGDRMLGLEVVGDKDPKVLASYDKRLAARVAKGLQAVSNEANSATKEASATVRKVSRNRPDLSETTTAPAEADAVTPVITGG